MRVAIPLLEHYKTALAGALILCLAVSCLGCASLKLGRSDSSQRVRAMKHDSEQAKALHNQALDKIADCKWEKAKGLVDAALLADSDFGPAHNTLGTIYLNTGDLYRAAWEFEHAAKLMPDICEPYNNLGLAYEQAAKYREAFGYYLQASEICPDNIKVVGNLARIRIILDDRGDDLREQLSELALSHPSRNWRAWARSQSKTRRFDEVELWSSPEFEVETTDVDVIEETTDSSSSRRSFEEIPLPLEESSSIWQQNVQPNAIEWEVIE